MLYALISLQPPKQVINVMTSIPNPLQLSNNSVVYAAGLGWNNGKYAIVDVQEATIPAGQQQSGPATYSVSNNNVVTQTIPTTTIPPASQATTLYNNSIAAGINLTWTQSNTLNGTYDIDQTSQMQITAESVSIMMNNQFTNGANTRSWLDFNNVPHTFDIPQFKTFATTVASYVNALIESKYAMSIGQNITWPSSSITITG